MRRCSTGQTRKRTRVALVSADTMVNTVEHALCRSPSHAGRAAGRCYSRCRLAPESRPLYALELLRALRKRGQYLVAPLGLLLGRWLYYKFGRRVPYRRRVQSLPGYRVGQRSSKHHRSTPLFIRSVLREIRSGSSGIRTFVSVKSVFGCAHYCNHNNLNGDTKARTSYLLGCEISKAKRAAFPGAPTTRVVGS
jgi:hypothetical protein